MKTLKKRRLVRAAVQLCMFEVWYVQSDATLTSQMSLSGEGLLKVYPRQQENCVDWECLRAESKGKTESLSWYF